MGKPTPGPWEVGERFRGRGGVWIKAPAADVSIAEVFYSPDESAECEANARLIASAPDLLEALEAFVGVRDQFPETVKLIDPKLDALTPVSVTVTKAQFLAAIAAIAKARGVQS